MRYFTKMYRDVPDNLYRFNIIKEEFWVEETGWEPVTRISKYLVFGEGDYEEITEEWARSAFPKAFEDVTKSIGDYEVQK